MVGKLLLTLALVWSIQSTPIQARSVGQCGLRLQLAVGAAIDQVQVDQIAAASALTSPEGQARVLTLVAVESSFDPTAVSGQGAVGLTQTLPIARAEVDRQWPGGQVGRLPLGIDVWYGSSYLRWCHDRYSSWTLAYACYNSGPTTTDIYLKSGTLPTETLYYIIRMWRLYEEHCASS